MLLTIFLSIVFCAAMAMMLISAVAFIQDNKFFLLCSQGSERSAYTER